MRSDIRFRMMTMLLKQLKQMEETGRAKKYE